MCIALISTAHPDYALILINNRDEFLNRPTAPAAWWESPNEHVLGGRDLEREVHGTWLGITRDGRVAVLTNFREEGQAFVGKQSRGAMVNAFLCQSPKSAMSTEAFVKYLVEEQGVEGVGGFSLICGRIGEPLAIISNRTPSAEGVAWIAKNSGETIGLSNAAFGDRSWPKVVEGEKLLNSLITKSVQDNYTKEQLGEALMSLLSTDTLPRLEGTAGWETQVKQLRKSIFIPVIGGGTSSNGKSDKIASANSSGSIRINDTTSGAYGTQKQSVLLIDQTGNATFMERSLFEESAAKSHAPIRLFEFVVQVAAQ